MIDFTFLRPWWLLALLVLLLWYVLQRRQSHSSHWQQVVDTDLLKAQTIVASRWARWFTWIMLITLTLAILALAGPSFNKVTKPFANTADTRLFLLDISLSMKAHDIVPTRMIAAQQLTERLLAESSAHRVGLIAYAGDAWMVVPITRDAHTVASVLDVIDTTLAPVQGSRPDLALMLALQMIQKSSVERAEIILFSDGFTGEKVFEVAKRVSRQGHRLTVIASGSTQGARIPLADAGYMRNFAGDPVVTRVVADDMQRLASAGGGKLAWLNDNDVTLDAQSAPSPETDLALAINASTHDVEHVADGLITWRDDGPWLLLPLLILGALAFRRGFLFCLPLVMLGQPSVSEAQWSSWWWRADQRVANAVRQGDLDAAFRLSPDGEWLGVVTYRRGEYDSAAIFFGGLDTADGHYNRGNALVKQERFADALQAYNTALRRDPNHADAVFNRDLVLEYIDEQQQRSADSQAASLADAALPDSQESGDPAQQQTQTASDTSTANQPHNNANDEAQAQLDDVAATASNERAPEYTEREKISASELDIWLEQIPDDPGGWLRRRFHRTQHVRDQNVRTNVGDAW